MNVALLYLPFMFQGIAILIDEFYFHHRRGLGLWERLGHPFDSLHTLVCYCFLLANSVTQGHILIYSAMCTTSCLLVTKDEWVHTEACDAAEHWLHALLFMSHPLSFVASFYLWWSHTGLVFIKIQSTVIALFLFYQILFWLVFKRGALREKN